MRSLKDFLHFRSLDRLSLTASVDYVKRMLEVTGLCNVFWQERLLDPTRINRAEGSTNNLQVDGLLFCHVL